MKNRKIEKPATWVLPRPDFDPEFLRDALGYVVAFRVSSDENCNRQYATVLESHEISHAQITMLQKGIEKGQLAIPRAKWRKRLEAEGQPDPFELHNAISDVIEIAEYCKEGMLFDEAVLLFEFAAEMCLELRNQAPGTSGNWLLLSSRALLLLGATFQKSEQYGKAQQSWLKLFDLAQLLDDSESAANARYFFDRSKPLWLRLLGDAMAAQGLYLDAEVQFTEAIKSLQQGNYDGDGPANELLTAEIQMFRMYIKANRAADGELVLQRAKERVAQSADEEKLICILGVEAQYMLDTGQLKNAQSALLQAVALADSLPAAKRYIVPRLKLSELYSRLGKIEDAANCAAQWLTDFDAMKREEAAHCGPDRLSNESALKLYKRALEFLSTAGEKYQGPVEELRCRIEKLEVLLAHVET